MSTYEPGPEGDTAPDGPAAKPSPPGKGRPTVQAEQRKAEVDRRVRVVRGLLEFRLYAADVLAVTQDKFGVNRATARRYVKAAKEELRASTGLTRREHRAVALEYYATVVRASLIPPAPKGKPAPTGVPGVPDGFRATVDQGLEAQNAIVKLLRLAVDRDAELDALKVTLRGLIATLEPHAAASKAALPAAEPDAVPEG